MVLTFDRMRRTALLIAATLLVVGLAPRAFAHGDGESTVGVDVRYLTVGTHFFAPERFTFPAGTPIRFLVTNVSRDHLHDILIVPDDGVTILGGLPELLHVGQEATIDWTPPAPGVYRLICAVCGLDEMIAYLHVG